MVTNAESAAIVAVVQAAYISKTKVKVASITALDMMSSAVTVMV